MSKKDVKTFKGFEFREVRKAKLDKLYLRVNYVGGDADTNHPDEYDLGIKYSEYKDHLEEIQKEIKQYKTLQEILEDHKITYKEIKEKYGEDMAFLYDNTPNDPQTDFDTKCYINDIELVAFDENGTKFESYV